MFKTLNTQLTKNKNILQYISRKFNNKNMKKILLTISAALALNGAMAQCIELFISEYVEGTNNNKALEVYNASDSPVSLANYRIVRWDNGSVIADQSPEGVMQLPTNITLEPYKTYVIALNLTDPNGTGPSVPIDTALQAKADTLLCPSCAPGSGQPRVLCFNGDDAISLQKNVGGTWTNVDIFASIGERPTNSQGSFSPTAAWTILPPFSSMDPNYDSSVSGPYFLQYWTQDKTLFRKSSIKNGVTTNPATESFNASIQWDSLPVNTFSGLGKHVCECEPTAIYDIENNMNASVFPNPSNGNLLLNAKKFAGNIQVINQLGQIVKSINVANKVENYSIAIDNLNKGFYFILFNSFNSKATVTKSFKIIVQ